MPYADPERERQSATERKRRYLERKHVEKYGPNAGGTAAQKEPEWQNDVQAAFGGLVQTPQG